MISHIQTFIKSAIRSKRQTTKSIRVMISHIQTFIKSAIRSKRQTTKSIEGYDKPYTTLYKVSNKK